MTALVTGASGALGRELAVLFSQTEHVILSGRNKLKLQETQNRCAVPRNTTIVCGSLLDYATLEHLSSLSNFSRLRYLICSHGEYQRKPLSDTAVLEAEYQLRVNTETTIKICKRVLSIFLSNGEGTIVNINSVAGLNASPDESVYSASKWGLTGFFKALRLEVREKGIRVLDAHLGGFKSQMTRLRGDFDYLMEPGEVAKVVYDLATQSHSSLQIEDVTIGRFNFPK